MLSSAGGIGAMMSVDGSSASVCTGCGEVDRGRGLGETRDLHGQKMVSVWCGLLIETWNHSQELEGPSCCFVCRWMMHSAWQGGRLECYINSRRPCQLVSLSRSGVCLSPPSPRARAGQGSLWLFRHGRSSDSIAGPLLSDPSSLAAAVPRLRECGPTSPMPTYTQHITLTPNYYFNI